MQVLCRCKRLPRATKTRQYDLLRPRLGQKEPPRSGRKSSVGQIKPPRLGQKEPPRFGGTVCYDQTWPERATETRQYDLLRPRVGQKEPPKFGFTICYGQELARKRHRDSAIRFVTAKRWPPSFYSQKWARKSHQDSSVRFVTSRVWAGKSHQD